MGACGLGLLDSDHDADLIGDLDSECGLYKLTEDAQQKAVADGMSENDASMINYSLFAGQCSDAKVARDFLASGALAKLIEDWKLKAFGPCDEQYWAEQRRYTLCFIGLGAMSHGCVLSEDFLDIMRDIFTDCGFMRDSLKQIDTALNGPNGFKNDGKPYDIFQMGRHEANTNPAADLLFPPRPGAAYDLMNTAAPFGMFAGPSNTELIKDIKTNMEHVKQGRTSNVCGQCGSSQEDLMLCGRCKARKYCNLECQKQHWKTHKLVCRKAATSA